MQRRWTYLLATLTLVMVALAGFGPGIQSAAARTWAIVRIGESGPNVYAVQAMLRQRGNTTVAVDGAFGSGTEAAVKSFQTANGLTADGVVGAATWEKLFWVVRSGDNNMVVNALQRELVKHGQSVTIDGAFGPGTLTAVKAFQTSKGLGADGVVGGDTWAALTQPAGTSGGGGTRAQLAATIRDSSRIGLATSHPSGVIDNAFARNNIVDTANGLAAKRSCYGNAPCGSVYLDTRMLNGMITLSQSWSYFVTEIAGASHSVTSRHYDGVAIDVGTINGSGVSSSNPYQWSFRSKCSSLGATEVLGPGDADHSTHIHCAWPRP